MAALPLLLCVFSASRSVCWWCGTDENVTGRNYGEYNLTTIIKQNCFKCWNKFYELRWSNHNDFVIVESRRFLQSGDRAIDIFHEQVDISQRLTLVYSCVLKRVTPKLKPILNPDVVRMARQTIVQNRTFQTSLIDALQTTNGSFVDSQTQQTGHRPMQSSDLYFVCQ